MAVQANEARSGSLGFAPPRLSPLALAWWCGTVAVTFGVTAFLIVSASTNASASGSTVRSVLFVGSAVHVAATAWFFTVPAVRRYALANPGRYLVAPAALVVGTAALAAVVDPARFVWVLVPYFAWQFFHYQKQNVGMAALAAVSNKATSPRGWERHWVVAAGVAGIAGLLAHPDLLALNPRLLHLRFLFPVAAVAYVVAVVGGILLVRRRPPDARPARYVVMYLLSLLFFAPVFVFSNPFAASASFATAHGFQYLIIVGLVAASDRLGRARVVSLALFLAIALLGGWGLDRMQHVSSGHTIGRILFGGYLGLVMSHFVIDAGLWRLRDEFPRRFLSENVPYLLRP